MTPQQTKTLIVLLVSIYIGYLYTSGDSNSSSEIVYTGKVPHVSLSQLDNIQYTSMDGKMRAFILGGTGAVGKELIKTLAADPRFETITLIGRREIPLHPDKIPGHAKMENKLIDFDKLDEYKDVFKGYDVGFSTLGTTRKKSGAEGFYKVDHDYVVQTAKLAKEGGCNHMHLVSSAGANKNAYFLYPKTKGEVEEELSEMGFSRLSIYRPAFLLLDEPREESRAAESCIRFILGPLDRKRWFSVDVPLLSKVMAANCFREAPSKSEILDNASINKFAQQVVAGNVPPLPKPKLPPPAPAKEEQSNVTKPPSE